MLPIYLSDSYSYLPLSPSVCLSLSPLPRQIDVDVTVNFLQMKGEVEMRREIKKYYAEEVLLKWEA